MLKIRKACLAVFLFFCILAGRAVDACTSFCLDNKGYALYGTNYDYTRGRHDGMVFVNKRNVSKRFPEAGSPRAHVSWTSRYGSVTFNFVASQTVWAGMNEAGLVVSLMRLEGSRAPAPDGRPWIHVHYWPQYVLDNFSSVAEVVAFVSSVRIAGSGRIPHYMVCDQRGRCASVEFLAGKAVVHAGDDLPVKVLTNTAYERSIAEWSLVAARRKAGEKIPPMGTSSRGRFIRAAERVAAFRPLDAEAAVGEAFAILADVSSRAAAWASNWSIVFDAGNLQVHFKTIIWPEIRTIDLQKLDFSCHLPVKLIDANEKLSGDISERLKDCSFRLHYGHALRAAKTYGLDMTPAELAEHIRRIESFPCNEPASRDGGKK